MNSTPGEDAVKTVKNGSTGFRTYINSVNPAGQCEGLPRWHGGKSPPASVGDAREASLIPGSGRSPGEEMTAHSSILTWEVPWTEEPDRPRSKELDVTGLLSL